MASRHTETSRNKVVALASKKGTLLGRPTVDSIPAATWVTRGQSIYLPKEVQEETDNVSWNRGFAEYLTSSIFSVQRGDCCPRFAEKKTEARGKIPYPRSHAQHIWHVHSRDHREQWEPPEDRTSGKTAGFAVTSSELLTPPWTRLRHTASVIP